jgi:hypothetical protein
LILVALQSWNSSEDTLLIQLIASDDKNQYVAALIAADCGSIKDYVYGLQRKGQY